MRLAKNQSPSGGGRWRTWLVLPWACGSGGDGGSRRVARSAECEEGEQTGGAEQEGQHQARRDEQEGHRRLARRAHDPGADEQVEGEVVDPPGKQQLARL